MGRYFNMQQAASRWQICKEPQFIRWRWRAQRHDAGTVVTVQVFSDNAILPVQPKPPGATPILHLDGAVS
jgi:hypothetical protein